MMEKLEAINKIDPNEKKGSRLRATTDKDEGEAGVSRWERMKRGCCGNEEVEIEMERESAGLESKKAKDSY